LKSALEVLIPSCSYWVVIAVYSPVVAAEDELELLEEELKLLLLDDELKLEELLDEEILDELLEDELILLLEELEIELVLEEEQGLFPNPSLMHSRYSALEPVPEDELTLLEEELRLLLREDELLETAREHSFTPPETLLPKVAWEQTKSPVTTL
jgi:hypothetical protein